MGSRKSKQAVAGVRPGSQTKDASLWATRSAEFADSAANTDATKQKELKRLTAKATGTYGGAKGIRGSLKSSHRRAGK